MEPGKKGLKVFQCFATGQVEDSSSSFPLPCLILGKYLYCIVSSPSLQHRLVTTEARKREEIIQLLHHKEIHHEFSE